MKRLFTLLFLLLALPALAAGSSIPGARNFGQTCPGPGAVCRAPFTPKSIPNLVLWLDANDASTITSSAGAVSQWNDKSGTGNNATQSTGANKPSTGSLTINNRNALGFTASSVSNMALTSGISGANGYTIFVVHRITSAGANPRAVIGGPVGSFAFRFNATTIPTAIVRQGQAVLLTGGTGLTAGTNYISVGKSISTGNQVWINGVSDGSNATNPSYTATVSRVGVEATGTNPYDGAVAEIILYTGDVSTANKNRVGQYLSAKYGIAWTGI